MATKAELAKQYAEQRALLFEAVHWLMRSNNVLGQCLEYDDEGLIELLMDDVEEFLLRARLEGIA